MVRVPNELLFIGGVFAMLAALVLQNVTVAGGRYGPVLLTALALTLAADACLAVVAWREGTGWRVAAIVSMLPTVFIVADFIRRAPYTF